MTALKDQHSAIFSDHLPYDLLEAAVLTAKDAIIIANGQDQVVFSNQAASLMFGYTSEEFKKTALHQIITVELDQDKYHHDFEELAKTGKTWVVGGTFDLIAKNKAGTHFDIELSVSSAKVDGTWYAVGFMRDTTKRHELEARLADEKEQAEKLNRLLVGREQKMVELKERLKQNEH